MGAAFWLLLSHKNAVDRKFLCAPGEVSNCYAHRSLNLSVCRNTVERSPLPTWVCKYLPQNKYICIYSINLQFPLQAGMWVSLSARLGEWSCWLAIFRGPVGWGSPATEYSVLCLIFYCLSLHSRDSVYIISSLSWKSWGLPAGQISFECF